MELKTLKDFEWMHQPKYMFIQRDLKEEAGKYLEDLDNAISKTYSGGENVLSDGELATLVMKKIQIWIKHFFNIQGLNAIGVIPA